MFLGDASSINEAVTPAIPYYYYFNRVAQDVGQSRDRAYARFLIKQRNMKRHSPK